MNYQISTWNKFRGMRTERQAADRRDRIVGRCLILCAIAYIAIEASEAIEQYATDRAATQAQQAKDAKAEETRAYKMLADCLNGRAIKANDGALFCERASFQGGL